MGWTLLSYTCWRKCKQRTAGHPTTAPDCHYIWQGLIMVYEAHWLAQSLINFPRERRCQPCHYTASPNPLRHRYCTKTGIIISNILDLDNSTLPWSLPWHISQWQAATSAMKSFSIATTPELFAIQTFICEMAHDIFAWHIPILLFGFLKPTQTHRSVLQRQSQSEGN